MDRVPLPVCHHFSLSRERYPPNTSATEPPYPGKGSGPEPPVSFLPVADRWLGSGNYQFCHAFARTIGRPPGYRSRATALQIRVGSLLQDPVARAAVTKLWMSFSGIRGRAVLPSHRW